MTKWGLKPAELVVCSAIAALLTGACGNTDTRDEWGGRPGSGSKRSAAVAKLQKSRVYGRGCPIPHDPDGEGTGPEIGTFIEMYAPHGSSLTDGAALTITPRGDNATIVVADALPVDLIKDATYQLGFKTDSKGAASYWLFDLDSEKSDPLSVASGSLRRSKGMPIDGYLFPGVTIYKTDGHTIEFGLRVNGWSLPVKLSQPKG